MELFIAQVGPKEKRKRRLGSTRKGFSLFRSNAFCCKFAGGVFGLLEAEAKVLPY
jgi:hypothetical protein